MDVFDLQAVLRLDKSGYDRGLRDAESSISSFSSKAQMAVKNVEGAFTKLAGLTAKAIAGAGAAAVGGVSTLAKQAVASFANYEQLVGGVETLFDKSAAKVQEYAKNAWQTAGLSANAYMQQATSFSASLVQSLGGDTALAADYADRAISDMSDNANKMGTAMVMIQNAYNGFAKQNYMMLDNLKLGYGGTKTEMERLIKDAASYTDIQRELNVVVQDGDMSFGNIVNAISVVQKKIGITGTTAKEAMFTIQGAANATKAAWQNVITAIAGGGDLKEAFATLRTALFGDGREGSGLLANIIPRVKQALGGIGDLIANLAPFIEEALPDLLDDILPILISSATSLFEGLIRALPIILRSISKAVPKITAAFRQILPTLIRSGKELIGAVRQGITEAAPDIKLGIDEIVDVFKQNFPGIGSILEGVWNIGQKVVDWWNDNKDDIKKTFEELNATIGATLSDIGKWLKDNSSDIGAIITGILDKLLALTKWVAENPDTVQALIALVAGLKLGGKVVGLGVGVASTVTNVLSMLGVGGAAAGGAAAAGTAGAAVAGGAGTAILTGGGIGLAAGLALASPIIGKEIGNRAGDWMLENPESKVTEFFVNFFTKLEELKTRITETKDRFVEWINGIPGWFAGIGESVSEWWNGVTQRVSDFFTGIGDWFRGIPVAISGMWESVKTWFDGVKQRFHDWIDRVKERFGEFKNAITEPFRNAYNTVVGWLNKLPNWVKNLFNIGESVQTTGGAVVNGQWYASAYDRPTIIGVGDRGRYKGGEMVGGMNEVGNMITNAVNAAFGEQGEGISSFVDRLLSLMMMNGASYIATTASTAAYSGEGISYMLNSLNGNIRALGGYISALSASSHSVPAVQWHAKSYDRPTLIGVGDRGRYKGGELVGGTTEIMGLITRAVRDVQPKRQRGYDQADMVAAFESALRNVTIELDDEAAGKFIRRTIEKALI